MNETSELLKSFQSIYGIPGVTYVRSPLRICPLGAHADHQKGKVTGMALDSSVDMVFAPTEDGRIRVRSLDFPDEEYFLLDQVPSMIPGSWGNYLRGAALSLKRDYVLKQGFNAIISGKIPIGGLSSSAAVTTAYLMALCDANGISMSKEDLIRYSHWVEIDYIGLNNGILDQSANILSRNDHLMMMDCQTGNYELVRKAPSMPDFEVIIVYSGVSKALIGTDYNNRVDECKVSAWLLQELAFQQVATLKEANLRDIREEDYLTFRQELPGRFRRRADHFFSEQKRVSEGVKAWKEGDLQKFGQLMFESGQSSIENYECGCPELITIYQILREAKGVYGARFSGAGYRGCCIGIVDPAFKESITALIDEKYPTAHPNYAKSYSVHFCRTDDGARLFRLE